jgi:hypothetical protein
MHVLGGLAAARLLTDGIAKLLDEFGDNDAVARGAVSQASHVRLKCLQGCGNALRSLGGDDTAGRLSLGKARFEGQHGVDLGFHRKQLSGLVVTDETGQEWMLESRDAHIYSRGEP